LAAIKKIFKLASADIHEEFFGQAALIGMASSKQVYNLCNQFNRAFDIHFIRVPHMDIRVLRNKETYLFPVYCHTVPDTGYHYYLYKLRLEEGNLLPGLRNIDYIWLINSDTPQDEAQRFLGELRAFADIQFVSLLQADKIKDAENLIL
jgi:hypothetical protein